MAPPPPDYSPIPSHDVVLPSLDNPKPPSSACPNKPILITLSVLLFLALVFIFWPSDPAIKIVRLRLDKIQVHTLPILTIDVSLHVTVKVRNVDLYSMDLNRLDVEVSYRGKRLGHVRSAGGHVRALASSFVDAEVELNGVSVLSDVVFLLEDLKKGSVSFDTVSQVIGKLGFLFFGFPLKAKLSCEIMVNVSNQKIARQHCYT